MRDHTEQHALQRHGPSTQGPQYQLWAFPILKPMPTATVLQTRELI